MVNETRNSRKTKEDEVGSSKKKSNDDASALRRSTRGQISSSPNTVRKSQRLEKRTPPNTPSVKSKAGNPSPLRKSGKDNKSNSPSSKGSPSAKGSKQQNKVSNGPDSSKKRPDKTLKELAKEVREQGKQNSNEEVGSKRKKWLDARLYKEMFKPLKKNKVSESESDKKSKLKISEDNGGSGSEKVAEGKQEHSDEEDLKGDCADDIVDDDYGNDGGDGNDDGDGVDGDGYDGGDGDSDNDGGGGDDVESLNLTENNNVGENKPCEAEDGEGVHLSSDHNVPIPSPRNEVAKNSDKADEVAINGSVMEKLSNQEMISDPKKLSDDGYGLGCSHKEKPLGVSAVGRETIASCPTNNVLSRTSCRMSIVAEECTKCFRKRRLEHNAVPEELCCCLSNTASDMNTSEDRGQSGNCIAEENGQNVKLSDSHLDVQRSICVLCKLTGKLLHCCGKGCRQSYHPSCSLNSEENIHLANWHCSDCTKKRMALGVHSVSQGIELILDVREVQLPNEDSRKQKQCFVKYRGLAHIHNRWVSEAQLLHEAPELCAQLGMQKEEMQWNPDWAVPHRLLKRRSVVIDDHCDQPIDQEICRTSNSQYEWLVKWCGLDYDQATWELEDSFFLEEPKFKQLVEEYEVRHSKVKRAPLSGSNEGQEKRKDSCYVNFVNRLKRHNAILLDEQDRIVKVIHLVSSLLTNACGPLLIITPHAFLSSWEDEFVRLAASVNVVVYGGNADARNIIRSLEFCDEDGKVMLHVLLSSAEIVAEDAKELKGIEWEAVIIDHCQQSCILDHSGCFMNLAIGWRLLLINTQLEDNEAKYSKILSLLEPVGSFKQKSGPDPSSDENMKVLKDRLSSFIICSSFLEYWVPVDISNLQLEQYCYTILSNSSTLRSFWKSDPVGSLRDILISLRKCCDHPYIADLQLQASLAEGLTQDAMMDLGIRASGKLYFLEKLLSELKNLELKVLILFQASGGSGRDSTGFILEDFLRWRFGSDSYEHVASGLVQSKKQAACNQFNNLRERSFFLLETRACSQTIKLSKINAVIIFDSDWNPHNDLRALQKVMGDSKLEQIKVFRLYCPCTIEEKVLSLAKSEMTLDSTLQHIPPSMSHMLLMWGSEHLFSRLDEFHREKFSDSKGNIVFESSILADVSEEFISLFHKSQNLNSHKYISVARQNGGHYLKSIPLMGEQTTQQEDGVSPLDFWTKLLEGKQPHWKYFSGSSQRSRKRVHYCEVPLSEQIDETAKKRKKMDSTKINSFIQQAELSPEKPDFGKQDNQENYGSNLTINSESMANDDPSSHKNIIPTLSLLTNGISGAPVIAEFDHIKILHDEQRGLIEFLKPTIIGLCEALILEDDGKTLAEQFLEYLVKNYRVTRKPETTLQALLLSVCWTAAEKLNKILDHRKSLLIARERLGFYCSEGEAEDIFSKLKPKMEKYSFLGNKISDSRGNSVESLPGNLRNTTIELKESFLRADCSKNQGSSPVQIEKIIDKYMKKVERGCNKQMERLRDKHKEELEELEKSWEERRMNLEKWCKVESAAIRVTHANSSVGIDKLRALDTDYAKKREELERKISVDRKELEAKQKKERYEEQTRIAGYIERAKNACNCKMLEESHAKNGVVSPVAQLTGPDNDPDCTVCIDRNLPAQEDSQRDSQRGASKTPESGRESIVSMLSEHMENTYKQRLSRSNDSVNATENIPASNGASISSLAPEGLGQVDLAQSKGSQCLSARPAVESLLDSSGKESPPEPPCAPGQTEKDVDNMDDVAVDKSTLACHHINRGSTTAPSPSSSPVASVTKQLTADIGQRLGALSCNRTGEKVLHATGNRNTLTLGETPSSNCSNFVPSDLPCSEGTSGSTEYSFNEWVTDPHNNDQVRIAPDSRIDNPPSGNHTSIGGTTIPTHQEHNGAVVLGEAISQPFPQSAVDHSVDINSVQNGTYVSSTRGAIPVHASHPNQVQLPLTNNTSRVPLPHPDPLQMELDKICTEKNKLMNFHEQKKLQLKSDCDKEIREVITQIKSKYDKKLDDAETAFSLRRNELEIYHLKVTMNKSLAEAFRSKCTEHKVTTRMQQPGHSSNSVESASRPSYTRPSTAGSLSASQPTAGPICAAPPVHGIRPSTTVSPPVRISHIAPSAVRQQQARREVRAPAPHIQAYRSVTQGISSSSMPSGSVLMAQPPNNPTSTSAPPLISLPPLPAQLNHHGQSNQGSLGGILLSNVELLWNVERQHGTNLCQLSPSVSPLPGNVHHSESQDLQCEGATNLQSPSSSLIAGDVVCLSDDE